MTLGKTLPWPTFCQYPNKTTNPFDYISADGKTLVKNLIQIAPASRLSAVEVLNCDWLYKFDYEKVSHFSNGLPKKFLKWFQAQNEFKMKPESEVFKRTTLDFAQANLKSLQVNQTFFWLMSVDDKNQMG